MSRGGQDAIEQLCHRYSYPGFVGDQLHALMDVIECTASPGGIRSVVLFGSFSRGEASVKSAGGAQGLFSDYEFLVITGPRERGILGRLREEVDDVVERWGIRNPFFHVDLGVNTMAQLYLKAPFRRNIANHEFWENGVVLRGRPLPTAPWLSRVTLPQLDLAATNELAIERLRQQLEYLLDEPSGSESDRREWRTYVAARNALDVLTVFLPNAGRLVPGYRLRDEAFRREFAGRGYFLGCQEQLMTRALDIKLSLDLTDPPESVENDMLGAYLSLGSYLARGAGSPAEAENPLPVVAALERNGARAFAEPLSARWLRKRRERRLAATLGLPGDWHRSEKRHLLLAMLLLAVYGIVLNRRGETASSDVLTAAVELAERITSADIAPNEDWMAVARWTAVLSGIIRGKIPVSAAGHLREGVALSSRAEGRG